MQTIVIDPGHGGSEAAGGSSPNNAVGPNGLLEKDVALDLGRRVATLLSESARVVLTRNDDSNLSLGARARVAADNDAALFASIHLNGFSDAGVDGVEAWVARGANERSKKLAQALVERVRTAAGLADRGVKEADFGVIKTDRHDPETGACLLEVAFLTNPDEATRLESDEYKQRLAQAIAEALTAQLASNGAPAPAVAKGLEMGEGSPLADQAVDFCWERTQQLRGNATGTDAPNKLSADQIRSQTGLTMERNPYWGITRQEIEAVVRAGYESHQLPEVLLALWAKEGSTQSVTSPMSIPQASTEGNAKTIARSIIFFQHLGSDYFIDTSRPDPAGDNTWDPSDAAAPQNEQRFGDAIRGLVTDGLLSEDISGAINAELTVSTDSAGHFAVLPTTRFYTLSLLAMDALFTKWQNLSYPELPSISVPMNYLQWNMGTRNFATFLQSADGHRAETRFPGAPIPLEQWTLETAPRNNEYRVPRTNAIKFKHYVESYRPIFQGSITLIKPGIEDLQLPANAASVVRALGTLQEDAVALVNEFRARGDGGGFTPGRAEVADRLVQLIQNPTLVDQASLNLCGPAAFHRVWIARDPVAFARYAISLYETGAGDIGTLHVAPDSDLRQQDYHGTAVPAMQGRAPAGANQADYVTPAAEWITMSSLRDVANAFFDYEGMPDEDVSAATTPAEVAEWMSATGLYSSVTDEGNWVLTKGLEHALGLDPGPNRDVILLVNAHVLSGSSQKKSDDFILRAFPNHFIVLESRITETPDGKVAFDYWSWGARSHVEVPKDVFNANYYGAVTGVVATATGQQLAEPQWHPPLLLPVWGVPNGRMNDGFLHHRRTAVHLGIDVSPDIRGDRSATDPRRGWAVYATPRPTLEIDHLNSSSVKAATKGEDGQVTVRDGLGIPGRGTATLRDVRVLRQPWTDRSDHSYGAILGIACRYAYTDPEPGVFTIYIEYLHLITADFPPKDASGTVIADWAGESGFGSRLPDAAVLSAAEATGDPLLVGYLGATQSPHVHINAAYAQGERGYIRMPRLDPREVLVDYTAPATTQSVAGQLDSPEEAVISAHTRWGDLKEDELARDILAGLPGQAAFANRVFDTLSSTDRDDVAYELVRQATDDQLRAVAADPAGKELLFRCKREMQSGWTTGSEVETIRRLVRAISPSHARLEARAWASDPAVLAALTSAGVTMHSPSDEWKVAQYILDEYTATMNSMPPGLTPEAYVDELLNDINAAVNSPTFNQLDVFTRRTAGTPPAVGDIYDIDILGPDNGSVMLVERTPSHWIFQTIQTGIFGATGSHPEYGAREFGFEVNADGSVTWYTRGAATARDVLAEVAGGGVQRQNWEQLVMGIAAELERRGGHARPMSVRSWTTRSY